MHTLGHLREEAAGNLLVAWVLCKVDRDKKLLGLLVNITNVNTTLVVEEDPVTLSNLVRFDRLAAIR